MPLTLRNGQSKFDTKAENDEDRMRRAFGPIGDEGRKAILKELMQAINSGKLSVQGLRGPPSDFSTWGRRSSRQAGGATARFRLG